MATFTRLVLLTLHLVLHVCANKKSSSDAVKWLESDRSVLIYLATPDLTFWNERDQYATRFPGAFIFNFTLAADDRTLLLNDEPILPRASPYVPTPLRAHQVGVPVDVFAHRTSRNFAGTFMMDLDYYIETPDTTSRTSIYNTKYNPRVRFDILRARIPSLPGWSANFSSPSQKQIWVFLEDLSTHPPKTPYSSIPLRIRDAKVEERWLDRGFPGPSTYKSLKSLKTCYIWSWLCADIDEYPYYEFIYQENFDQYGKKGSMRHFLTRRWGNLVALMGVWRAIILLAVCGSMVLSPFVYAIYRGVKATFEMYQQRVQEVDEWVADEEVEGLLMNDRYAEDFEDVVQAKEKVVEKDEEMDIEGTGSEKTPSGVEESLPPNPPPYALTETEKNSTS